MPISINGSTGITGVAAIDNVSSTELGYLDGATSNVQTQLNAKAANATQGMYLLYSQTFSGANITVDNIFTTTYLNYKILLSFTSNASGDNEIYFRYRRSGVDDTSNNYLVNRIVTTNGSLVTVQSVSTSYYITALSQFGNRCMVSMELWKPRDDANPGGSVQTQFTLQSGQNRYETNGFASYNLAAGRDGFVFFPQTAMTLSGYIRVYGFKD